MSSALAFYLGMLVGGFLGVLTAGMLAMMRQDDDLPPFRRPGPNPQGREQGVAGPDATGSGPNHR